MNNIGLKYSKVKENKVEDSILFLPVTNINVIIEALTMYSERLEYCVEKAGTAYSRQSFAYRKGIADNITNELKARVEYCEQCKVTKEIKTGMSGMDAAILGNKINERE